MSKCLRELEEKILEAITDYIPTTIKNKPNVVRTQVYDAEGLACDVIRKAFDLRTTESLQAEMQKMYPKDLIKPMVCDHCGCDIFTKMAWVNNKPPIKGKQFVNEVYDCCIKCGMSSGRVVKRMMKI